MATFSDCRTEFLALNQLLTAYVAQNVVAAVTIEEPTSPLDELHFRKLVAWAYVVLVEAMPVPMRQISQTMRAADSTRYKSFADTRELVEALRTVHSHNMATSSQRNQRQLKISKVWLQVNAGNPTVWSAACSAMAGEILTALGALLMTCNRVVSSDADRDAFVENMRTAIEQDWPAHSFDAEVSACATKLRLERLDVVAYRKERFKRWRELASLFPDRDAARAAVARVIEAEMISLFGSLTGERTLSAVSGRE
ncbi:MAG: hypothetical protein EOP20_00040 [Hyphomicrobiales bacterium]|nr:MAG: hypothetical protein EOP20_00040 [Hyphomicrobiales bacterium]